MRKQHLFSGVAVAAFALAVAPSAAMAKGDPAPGGTAGAAVEGAAQASDDDGIIVTAQRREQTLAEIPQSISVVGGETLERQQATSFLDYAQLVPGLSLTQENPGESRLILRGVNTGSVGSTVAVYVDDVPFGSSGSLSNAGILAGDFDTFDVARVEVLRGPQGTLYGSNALGGVMKFITATPDFSGYAVRGQAGLETVKDGGTGYFGNAMVNIPLGSTLGLRASGFYRSDDGYVDAVGRAATGVNKNERYGGRATLLFQPTDDFSIKLFGLMQNIRVDSPSSFAVNPVTQRPINPLTGADSNGQRLRFERYPELNEVDYRMYSGTIDYDFGFAGITSVTSYATQDQKQISDISTNAARGTANAVYAPTAPNTVGLIYQNDIALEKFTQEVRLTSADSDVFEWLIGGYYTHEKSSIYQEYLPFTLATQALIPPATTFSGLTFQRFVYATIDAKYEEIAGFASATLHLGDRFEITAGGRYSHNSQTSTQAVVQLGGGAPQNGSSSEGVFTYSIAPRFELSDYASVYARVAKGYRPGGPNFVPPGAPAGFPTEFLADTIISYEAGLRAETPDRRFGLDVSAFVLDWDDILILSTATVAGTPVGVNSNGRRARSKGVEATVTLRPTRGLTAVITGAFTDAKLLDDTIPASGGLNLTGGLRGDVLPYSPRWSSNISIDYDWDLGGAEAFVGGSVRMVGDQVGGFSTAYRTAYGRRVNIDGYATLDLRAGVDFGGITASLYARNLTDTYGVVSAGGYPATIPAALGGTAVPYMTASTIRPRTIGGSLGFRF